MNGCLLLTKLRQPRSVGNLVEACTFKRHAAASFIETLLIHLVQEAGVIRGSQSSWFAGTPYPAISGSIYLKVLLNLVLRTFNPPAS